MFRNIVMFCLMFLICSFFGIIIISNMNTKKKWLKILVFIITTSIIAGLFSFGLIQEADSDIKHGIMEFVQNAKMDIMNLLVLPVAEEV